MSEFKVFTDKRDDTASDAQKSAINHEGGSAGCK